MANILAIDPGSDKCGLAVVDSNGTVIDRQLIATPLMEQAVQQIMARHEIAHLVVGNSTTSAGMRRSLSAWLPHVTIEMVDEHGSTMEARRHYWQAHPPRGWRRLLPLSLQVPPEPVNDFAAVVLALRYLSHEEALTR